MPSKTNEEELSSINYNTNNIRQNNKPEIPLTNKKDRNSLFDSATIVRGQSGELLVDVQPYFCPNVF
jgi:hypothetical protein